MSAVDTYRDALFGNPPSPTTEPSREGSLAAFTELYNLAVVAQYASAAGITIVPTIAARDTFYATEANRGKLVYVNNNNGSATDPANGVYEYVGAPRLAQSFYASIAVVVQPLVDEAVNAKDDAVAAAEAADLSAQSAAKPLASVRLNRKRALAGGGFGSLVLSGPGGYPAQPGAFFRDSSRMPMPGMVAVYRVMLSGAQSDRIVQIGAANPTGAGMVVMGPFPATLDGLNEILLTPAQSEVIAANQIVGHVTNGNPNGTVLASHAASSASYKTYFNLGRNGTTAPLLTSDNILTWDVSTTFYPCAEIVWVSPQYAAGRAEIAQLGRRVRVLGNSQPYAADSYVYRLADYFGWRLDMQAQPGSGIVSLFDNPAPINGAAPDVAFAGVAPDLFYIAFGDNDANTDLGTIDDSVTTRTFYGAYNKVMQKIITDYPLADIALGTTHTLYPRLEDGAHGVAQWPALAQKAEATRLIARKYGAKINDLAVQTMSSAFVNPDPRRSDGLHYNEAGQVLAFDVSKPVFASV